MIIRSKRRVLAVAFAALLILALSLLNSYWNLLFFNLDSKWQQWSWVSGWLLFTTLMFLISLSLRKRLTFLPLGRAYTWVQLHIYGGVVAIVIFGLHTRWSWPNGFYESVLALLLWLTAISGIVGILLSRSLPKMMNGRSERIFMSRLAGLKASLARDVTTEVDLCLSEGGSARLLKLYQYKILPYLDGTQDTALHFLAARSPYRRWNDTLDAEQHYLNSRDKQSLPHLRDLIHKKIDYDFQHVMQRVLKGWLFFHIPISFALISMTILHIILVYSFIGG